VTGPLRTGRQGLLVAVAGTAAAGAVLLVVAGRTWGSAVVETAVGGRVAVSATGSDVTPALPALGISLLVLAVAIIAARAWMRRLVGLVVVVVGGAALALAVTASDDVATSLMQQALAPTTTVPASTSGWAIAAAVAAGAAVVTGALTVLFGGAWPGLGSRYDAPSARARDETASAWDALDRGDDPTA
jgi:uncharacterized membrane protein (TIGR02234 family)